MLLIQCQSTSIPSEDDAVFSLEPNEPFIIQPIPEGRCSVVVLELPESQNMVFEPYLNNSCAGQESEASETISIQLGNDVSPGMVKAIFDCEPSADIFVWRLSFAGCNDTCQNTTSIRALCQNELPMMPSSSSAGASRTSSLLPSRSSLVQGPSSTPAVSSSAWAHGGSTRATSGSTKAVLGTHSSSVAPPESTAGSSLQNPSGVLSSSITSPSDPPSSADTLGQSTSPHSTSQTIPRSLAPTDVPFSRSSLTAIASSQADGNPVCSCTN